MTGNDIGFAAQKLREGALVAIPTETVYGLAANAFDKEAVTRIFEAKQRPQFNPLIVHTSDIERVNSFTTGISGVLEQLATTFWPGPLTILLPRNHMIHPLVTAGSDFVAVRIPNHPMTLALLRNLEFPLAAPSANLFGRVSPTTAAHVEEQLGEKVSYILDGGNCAVGVESTIVKLKNDGVVNILRPGGVSAEMMHPILGYEPEFSTPQGDRPEAPGMLKSHYAPKIPLVLGEAAAMLEKYKQQRVCLITFSEGIAHSSVIRNIILSGRGDLHEAAQQLFSALHEAENEDVEIIIAERVPEIGIGIAINDRLERASA